MARFKIGQKVFFPTAYVHGMGTPMGGAVDVSMIKAEIKEVKDNYYILTDPNYPEQVIFKNENDLFIRKNGKE